MKANASILLAEQVLNMDLGTPKGLHAKALARDVLKQQDYMLQTLRLIAHATKPEPDDGGGHENAYELATQCIAAVESPQEGTASAALSTPPAPRAPSIEPAEPVARFLKLGESIETHKLCFVELLGAPVPDAKLYYAAPAAGVEEFPLPEPEPGWFSYTAEQVREILRSYSASLGLQARTEGEQA